MYPGLHCFCWSSCVKVIIGVCALLCRTQQSCILTAVLGTHTHTATNTARPACQMDTKPRSTADNSSPDGTKGSTLSTGANVQSGVTGMTLCGLIRFTIGCRVIITCCWHHEQVTSDCRTALQHSTLQLGRRELWATCWDSPSRWPP